MRSFLQALLVIKVNFRCSIVDTHFFSVDPCQAWAQSVAYTLYCLDYIHQLRRSTHSTHLLLLLLNPLNHRWFDWISDRFHSLLCPGIFFSLLIFILLCAIPPPSILSSAKINSPSSTAICDVEKGSQEKKSRAHQISMKAREFFFSIIPFFTFKKFQTIFPVLTVPLSDDECTRWRLAIWRRVDVCSHPSISQLCPEWPCYSLRRKMLSWNSTRSKIGASNLR